MKPSFPSSRRLTTLLRCAEAVAAAALILRLSARIPAAARSSGELLRLILGPRFLFLLGNAIVLTLVFRSRRLPKEHAADEIPISISALFFPPPETGAALEEKRGCCAEPLRVQSACWRRVSQGSTMEGQPRRRRSTELRRSETEVGKLKEEEFRRTVEAFIEKQWRFLQREGSLAIVCSSDTGLEY